MSDHSRPVSVSGLSLKRGLRLPFLGSSFTNDQWLRPQTDNQINMTFRRLLKDVATGSYYDGKGGWTLNEADAHDFKDSQEAVKAAIPLKRETLHLVLKFPDSRMDVSHRLAGLQAPAMLKPKGQDLIISSLLPATVQALHLFKKIIS